jgi:hypothetical protein
MRFAIVITLALLGCSKETPKSNALNVERIAPEPQRTLQVGTNQLISVQIPGQEWHSTQKCYIFRDLEFKTSSISCPAGATGKIEPD